MRRVRKKAAEPWTCREEHCMRGEKKEEEFRWGKSNIE
jgi:hypothetical protein